MIATVCTLASGSSGNSLYVGVGESNILVDVGIGYRSLSRALTELGVSAEALSAVLLTHEHWDHVRGLGQLRSRFPHVPVLATTGTARAVAAAGLANIDGPGLRPGSEVSIGDFRVTPVRVSHDATQPVGFRIACGDFSLAVFTDLGVAPVEVARAMLGCQLLVVEANHDDDMLWMGRYPMQLKRRIASPRGHLSNQQCASLLATVAGPSLEQVVLAHLSEENNEPGRAIDAAALALAGSRSVSVLAAPRTAHCTPLHCGAAGGSGTSHEQEPGPRQLGLFG